MSDQNPFDALFNGPPSTVDPVDNARYWSHRRGRGEPTPDDVARELVWEAVVSAHDRGALIEARIIRRADAGWVASIGALEGLMPIECAELADPPLAAGERALRVLKYDRVLEILQLRPVFPGEPV